MHSNVESKCAGYQTVAKNQYITDLSKKVHCGRVKRWVADARNVAGGGFVYDGPCECHVKGSHPNGDGGLLLRFCFNSSSKASPALFSLDGHRPRQPRERE